MRRTLRHTGDGWHGGLRGAVEFTDSVDPLRGFRCAYLTARFPAEADKPAQSGSPPELQLTSSRLAQLLTQAVQGSLLAADAEERTFIVGALLQHFTAREYFPAQLLC